MVFELFLLLVSIQNRDYTGKFSSLFPLLGNHRIILLDYDVIHCTVRIVMHCIAALCSAALHCMVLYAIVWYCSIAELSQLTQTSTTISNV